MSRNIAQLIFQEDKNIPAMENMHQEVLKMAHKEIIKNTIAKYALEKIAEVCKSEIIVQIPNAEGLMDEINNQQ